MAAGDPTFEGPTRERLVQAAMYLFWAEGYQTTPISRILEVAGANPGSLYHYFATKEELLIAVLDAYIDGIGPNLLDPAWEGVDDPVERVFTLLAQYRKGLELTGMTYGCPIGNLALEMSDPPAPVRERLAKNFEQWIDAVEGCLVAARDRFPAGADLRALSVHVLTTMEGAVMQARTARDLAPFDASIAALRHYFDLLHAAAGRAEPSTGDAS
ncbi:MAG TPA: TetR/AcrR family transcriptional regulator [Gemmatimonadota bacterium]|nr:TetR/AcrR family transcriptional regulator [Gemmatimonadota bacterium]